MTEPPAPSDLDVDPDDPLDTAKDLLWTGVDQHADASAYALVAIAERLDRIVELLTPPEPAPPAQSDAYFL